MGCQISNGILKLKKKMAVEIREIARYEQLTQMVHEIEVEAQKQSLHLVERLTIC